MSSDIDQRHQHTKEVFSRPDCQLSYLNGVINRMEKEDIRIQLRLLGLDDRGVKKVLKKRLKNYYKKQKLPKPKQPNKSVLQHDYYIVIDFEGTCEEKNSDNYVHEIIEFPAILINGNTLELEDEFHQYCKPTKKTILSEFCQNLTGITQETVDAAQPFSTVLNNFMEWLEKHKLDGITHTFAIITDGPWDLGKFLPVQCTLSGISIPGFASKWVNLRKHYRRYYQIDRDSPMTLEGILEKLGMPFEGRPHSGIDDARNIAKMFVKMVSDGLEPRINDDYAKHERLRSV